MLKITLLAVALLTVFGSAAIAPILADIALSFPENSDTEIKALLTAPALMMIFTSPLTGFISGKIGQKNLVIFALVCYVAGGLAGGVASSYESLFLTRLLLGVGIGFLMPMSSALIAQHYTGKERLQLLGWAASATNLFGIAGSLLVGYLALLTWRYGFLIYGVALISLLLIVLHLPHQPSIKQPTTSRTSALPIEVYGWLSAIFLQMIAIYSVPVNIALFISENALGDSKEAGISYACLTLAGFIAGLIGVQMRELIDEYFGAASLLLMALGFYQIVNAYDMPSVLFALGVLGFASGVLMPYLIYGITNATHDSNTVTAMGLMAMVAALAQFATPFTVDSLAHLLGDGSTRSAFMLVGIASALASAVALTKTLWSKRYRAS
jgi:predicted MFS family arabinose efflux permease